VSVKYYRVGVWTNLGAKGPPSCNGVVYRTRADAEASARDLMSRWLSVMSYKVFAISFDEVEALGLAVRDGPTIKGAGHRVQL